MGLSLGEGGGHPGRGSLPRDRGPGTGPVAEVCISGMCSEKRCAGMWGARVWSVREVEILRLLISESKVLGASVKSKTLGERTGPTAPHHLPALKG